MPISVECSCGAKLKAKDELAGKRLACPKCKQPVLVQAAQPIADDDDPLGLGDLSEPAPVAGIGSVPQMPSPGLPGGQAPAASPSTFNPGSQGQFQPAKPGAAPANESGGGKTKLILFGAIGGGVLSLLVVVGGVGAVMMMGGGDDDSSTASNEGTSSTSSSSEAGTGLQPGTSNSSTSPLNSAVDQVVSDPFAGLDPAVLKQVCLAMGSFESLHKYFPTASSAGGVDSPVGLSWRVHLLPFLDEQALYDEFHLDEPWDSEHNLSLVAKMPTCYQVPGLQPGKTTIHAFVGKLPNDFNGNEQYTVMGGDQGIELARISDGTGATIFGAIGEDETAEEWTQPGGLTYNVDAPFGQVKTFGDQFVVFTLGGTVGLVSSAATNEDLARLFTPREGLNPSRNAYPKAFK